MTLIEEDWPLQGRREQVVKEAKRVAHPQDALDVDLIAPAARGLAGACLDAQASPIRAADLRFLIEELLDFPAPADTAVFLFWRQGPDDDYPRWIEWRILPNSEIPRIRLGRDEHARLFEVDDTWDAAMQVVALFPWSFTKAKVAWAEIFRHRYHPGDLLGDERPGSLKRRARPGPEPGRPF
jgi:hypothetical protein